MTQSALPDALRSIENVRRFIRSSESKVSAVKHILSISEDIARCASTWARDVAEFDEGRKYDFACAVIMLYGAMERFVEDSAEEAIAGLLRVTESYEDLPARLRTVHFDLTLTHLARTRESRYDRRIGAQELVQALSSCLSSNCPFEFITDSMLHHSANFRVQIVDDFYARLDLSSASILAIESTPFQAYLTSLGITVSSGRPEAILDRINLLVSMRNEVAHGDMRNILAPSELMPYCDQLEAYCRGLSDALDSHVVSLCTQERH
ncbi:MAG: hypothetical protein IPK97_14165 [Ahniella sp.]|nr:hypothetical protein [Ahniella sp.]